MLNGKINISCYRKVERRRKSFLSSLKCYIIKLLTKDKKSRNSKHKQLTSFVS